MREVLRLDSGSFASSGPIWIGLALTVFALLGMAAPAVAVATLEIDSVTHSPSSVVAGSASNLIYTVTVANTATGLVDDATNVLLVVPLAGSPLQYQSETFSPGSCSMSGSDLNCALGSMQENTSRVGDIVFTVAASGSAGTLTTSFSVTSTEDSTPDSQTEDVTISVEADLVVDKQAPATNEAVPGQNISYTIEVENAGPSDATNVVLTDPAPTGWTFVSFSSGPCGATTAPCNLGTIEPGAVNKKTVTATFSVPDNYHLVHGFGDVTNTASVTTSTPDAGSSVLSDDVMTPIVPKVDLSVDVSSAATSVTPGEPLTFQVTVSKTGPSRLDSVHLTGALFDVLSQVYSPAEGVFNVSSTSPNWTAIDLAGSDNVSLTLTGWLRPGVTGSSLSVQVIVEAPAGVMDTDGGNDDDTEIDTIAREADLRIVKSNGLDGVIPGQTVPYAITVFNEGPSDVIGATVSDTFGATFVSSVEWSCSASRDLTGLGVIDDGDAGVDGLDGASSLVASPDGLHVYVAGSADDSVAYFTRDSADGMLTWAGLLRDGSGASAIEGASGVAISPDGATVYVTGAAENALEAFSRNAGSGALTSIDTEREGQASVTGMTLPQSVAVSPDGRHVYVAAATTNAVVVFTRNTSTGTLAWSSTVKNGDVQTGPVTVSGLGGARAVAVAPDGHSVVVAGETDNAVVVFSRDISTGALSFIQSMVDSGATDGLAGASGLAFAPHGNALYVAGHADNAVVALSRDVATGLLSYLESETDGVGSPAVDGLAGARGVAVSPDGVFVFVAGAGDGRIAVFSRIPNGAQANRLDYLSNFALSGAFDLMMTPAGEQLYGVSKSADRLGMFSESSGAACSTPAGSVLAFSELVDLPAQSFVTYTATAVVSGSASGDLENTASITAPGGVTDALDPHPAGVCSLPPGNSDNNSCTDIDQVGLEADIVVTKTVSAATAVPGEALAYTLVVSNIGPASASGITVTDNDLTGADFASVSWTCTSANGAVCGSPTSGTGNINHTNSVNLPAGGSVTYAIDVSIAAAATGSACIAPLTGSCVINSASASLPSGFIDPTPGNPDGTAQSQLSQKADLAITKTVLTLPGDIAAGDPLDFQIVVRNCGPSNVLQALVQDNFSPDYVLTNWTCTATNGACPAGGSADIAALVDLQSGDPSDCSGAGTATFTIFGDVVASPSTGVLTNIARVFPPSGAVDPTQGNNTTSVQVGLRSETDLSIVKTDGTGEATPGEEITYVVTVSNSGPDNAQLVQVVDFLPPELRNVSWTCSSEAPASGLLTFVEEQRQGGLSDLGPITGLQGAREVVVVPDSDGPGPDEGGKFVYATGSTEGALAIFLRDLETAELTYLGKVLDGDSQGILTVDGLAGANGLAVSPDGLNLYVAGETDDAVAVFTRNTLLGSVSFVESITDGQVQGAFTVDGLDGAFEIAISPDGKHLYVTSPTENSVTVFGREAALSGRLAFQQVIKDGDIQGVLTVDGLGGATGVRISPDGHHVYVTGALDGAVAVFLRETNSGLATFGELTYIESLVDSMAIPHLDGASGLEISSDGAFVYVTATVDDSVSIFSRNTTTGDVANFGRLTYRDARFEGEASGLGGAVSGMDGARQARISPDGQHLYIASATSDAVVVFQRNSATGSLKFLLEGLSKDGDVADCVQPPICTIASLDGSRSLALDPTGQHLYVAADVDSAITVFKRGQAPPAFQFTGGTPGADPPAPVVDGVNGVDGLDGITDLVVVDEHLYSVSFADESIVSFLRDPSTGNLTQLGRLVDDIGGVAGLAGASAVTAFGNSLYVVGESVTEVENTLALFSRDSGTGLLQFEEVFRQGQDGVDGLFGAVDVVVSPDGLSVYAVGFSPGSLAVFSRDPGTGSLTFKEAKIAGTPGIVGLQGARGVQMSSDGEHVYVASSVDDAVAVFRRNTDGGDVANFGRVSQIQAVTGLPALDRAIGVAVSNEAAGSRNVYVTGFTANALTVFQRNVELGSDDFGKLTVLQTFVDEEGAEGLAGARAVEVSPDGKQVYVAGENDDALVVFAREATGGTLVFVEARRDGLDGVEGLDQAYAVAISANSSQAYVAGFGDDAIAAFNRASGSRCTGAGVGKLNDTNVEIAAGGQVVYTIHATIDPSASGELVNEVQVIIPSSISDPGPDSDGLHPAGVCVANNAPGYPVIADNNGCRDIDMLKPRSDLAVDKTDGGDVAIPGEELTYTITVSNDGPSNIVGVPVYDDVSAIFPTGASWTCVATPSGTLSFLDSYFEGDVQPGPVTLAGLEGASSVTVSPDGRHVYTTGLNADALSVFEVDEATGALTFLAEYADGDGPIVGLNGASDVKVSPDGVNLYAIGQIADSVVVFTRDNNPASLTFGELTFLEVQQAPAVSDLDQPTAIALDAAGENLYVTAANSGALLVFVRHPVTGALTFLETQENVDGLAGASAVAVSPDGQHVYATGENDHSVVVFDRAATGALTFSQSKRDGIGGAEGLSVPKAVVISPDGANVYVAGSGENAIAVFARDLALGTLTYRQVLRDGIGDVDGLAGVSALAVSDDNGLGFHVYAVGSSENALAIFRRNAADEGRLTFVDAERNAFGPIEGLDGISATVVSPSGQFVFATGAIDDAVVAFRRPTDSSCSSGSDFVGPPIELIDTIDVAAGSQVVYEITGVVDPDLCPSYPCNAVDLSNTATVSPPAGIDPVSENNTDTDVDDLSPRANLSITKTDHISVIQGLEGASAVVVSQDGESVYAVGKIGDGVAAFQRAPATGALTFLESKLEGVAGVDGLNGASGVLVSGDDAHVFVTGSGANALVVFERESSTTSPDFGKLTFLEKMVDGFGGVTGLLGPNGMALSADGRHLYVASANSSSVAIFARVTDTNEASYGHLTFVGEVRDGVDGVEGLSLARALVLAPGGDQLYVVGEADNALAVFDRDGTTGELSFVEIHSDTVAGVSGLAGARGLAISPDGAFVYVSGGTANAIAQFARDTGSGSPDYGKLTFEQAYVDGIDGIDGLQGAHGLLVVPDPSGPDPGGEQLYAAAGGENAIAVFSRDPVTGDLSFEMAARQGELGVDGLEKPVALAMSPDAASVYAASAQSHGVVTFDRDWDNSTQTGTGELAFVEMHAQGDGAAAPGQVVTYEIVVTNHGPSAVRGAVVTDIFPGELENVAWTCSGLTPGATCLSGLSGTGDLNKPVRLPPGGSVKITANGTIKSGAVGTIVNTATVTEPDGFIELDPSDNSATDGDTLLGRVSELRIDKIACTDPGLCPGTVVTDLIPGTRVHYQIQVENDGLSDVDGAKVTDILPEVLSNAVWTCEATPLPGLLSPLQPLAALPPIPALFDGDAVPIVNRRCQSALTSLDGLAGSSAVALSPDGLNVYVTGADDHAVAIFRRDLRNGSLIFNDVVLDGQSVYDSNCDPIDAVDGLSGASGVVVSPDGLHVYVMGELDDAVAVFERLPDTGNLQFVQFLRDSVGGVNGLGNVSGAAISPDGKHLYTAARSDQGVGIFARNAGSGFLTYLGLQFDGASQPPLTVDGLAGASAVAVSPDGVHVYVSGEADDGIAVFIRDAATGLLTFVEAKKDGVDGVSGLAGAKALALADDGRHLYVASGVDNAVAVFEREAETGKLTFVETHFDGVDGAEGLEGAAGVFVSPDGEHVYVASPIDSAIALFSRDSVTGSLMPMPPVVDDSGGFDGLSGARALSVSPDGEQVYAAGGGEHALALLSRNDGSRCTSLGFGNLVDSVDLVAGGKATYSLAADLSATAVGSLLNTAVVEEPEDVFDPELTNNSVTHTAQLTPHVNLTLVKDDFQTDAIPGLPLTYTISVSNAGPSNLVAGTIEDLFPLTFVDAVWSCEASETLGFVGAEFDGLDGVLALDAPRGIVVSPDPDGAFGPLSGGQHVYVASYSGASIDLFERDAGTGELSFLASYVDGTDGMDGFGGAGGLAFSPDGAHLYATGTSDDAIAVLSRDVATGELTLVEVLRESDPVISGLDGASAVTVSHDGRTVYVGSEENDSVVVFDRDSLTGELTFVERVRDGFDGLELGVIDRPAAMVLSPDDRHLLVVSADSDSLAIFERAPESGTLSFLQVLRDGEAGVDGLDLAQDIVVSPSGQFVYAAGLADDSIVSFLRDPETGLLTYLDIVKDGVGGVSGLDGVRGLTLSSDGLFLFATGFNADALAIFQREGVSGALAQLQVVWQGAGGVEGMDGARASAISPDGSFVYVVGEHADAVAVFARVGQGGCAAAGTSDLMDTVDLAIGAQITYQIQGIVDSSATGLLVNTVTASMPPGTTNLGDTSATDIDNLTPVSDLSILKSDGLDTAVPGGSTIYLITVANPGPSDAPATSVTDTLPVAALNASWSCSGDLGGVCNSSGIGDLAETVDLPAGSSVVFALAAAIDPAALGLLVNTATVAPAAGVFDPELSNNQSTDTDTLVPSADLSLVKTVDVSIVETLAPIEFTLSMQNDGPSMATDVTVVDLLPSDTVVVTAGGAGWACTPAAGSLTCTRSTLLPGVSPPIVIAATAPTVLGNHANGAIISASTADPAMANNTGTVAFTVVALEPPTVVLVDTVDSTGDGELSQMETAEVSITQLAIQFSEELFDPPGDADPNDVTNPASYLLLEAGPDGLFATGTCGLVVGDDVAIAIDSVAYSSGSQTAELNVGGGSSLADGLFRLAVCGTAGVLDLDGNAIDGNNNAIPGDDFYRFFRVKLANVFDRPHFDFPSDLDAWLQLNGLPIEYEHSPLDSDGFPLSGSILLSNIANSPSLEIFQCQPVFSDHSWLLSGRARVDLLSGSATVRGHIELVQGDPCDLSSAAVLSTETPLLVGATGGLWHEIAVLIPDPPPGVTGLRVRWRVETSPGDRADIWLDSLYLGDPLFLFLDGFESGDTLQWSSTVP